MTADPWFPGAERMPYSFIDKRPVIDPRIGVLHANANGSATTTSPETMWKVVERNWLAYQTGNASSIVIPHFQLDHRNARLVQYLPVDRKGACNYRANDFSIGVETSDDGAPTLNNTPWSLVCCRKLCDLMVWAHNAGWITAKQAEAWDGSGWGWHNMWGVNTAQDHTVNPWTAAIGKWCPGQARANQSPIIIATAAREVAAPPTPNPTPPPATGADPMTYDGPLVMVHEGDGWYAVTRRAYGSTTSTLIAKMQEANGGAGRVLHPGELLVCPGKVAP